MRKGIALVLVLVAFVVYGCAHSPRPEGSEGVKIGISKQEVIDILGEPKTITKMGKEEFLMYNLKTDGKADDYFIRITDKGEVAGYGTAKEVGILSP